jgi:thiol-disulfide isomerase/thioredoxin
MKERLRKLAMVAAIAIIAAAAGYGTALWLRSQDGGLPPSAAAGFELKDLAGKTYKQDSWPGKVVVLNFWATWCPPCLKEIPGFIRLQEKYGPAGLQFVGISVDNPEAVARFWQDMKINYPLLLADDHTFDLMAAYGNPRGGLPYSAIIAPSGEIVATRLGAYDEVELENILQPLLPGKKPSTR